MTGQLDCGIWKPEKKFSHLKVILKSHIDRVAAVSFSEDGKTILSGSWDKTIKMWDSQTGAEIDSLRGHLDAVLSVAWSLDGKTIISGSSDRTLKIWRCQ